MDRFDLVDSSAKGEASKWLLAFVCGLPPLRWLAHVCTQGTMLLGIKQTIPSVRSTSI